MISRNIFSEREFTFNKVLTRTLCDGNSLSQFLTKISWKQRFLTKELISRNIFFVRENVSFFYTQYGKPTNSLSLTEKNISWNQLFSYFLHKIVAFTKFLSKKCEKEFLCCARDFQQKFREINFFNNKIDYTKFFLLW